MNLEWKITVYRYSDHHFKVKLEGNPGGKLNTPWIARSGKGETPFEAYNQAIAGMASPPPFIAE
jgi:hypothetical protein